MRDRLLPPELVSLVHHIELNKVGWWDKGIQQLVVVALWLSGKAMTAEDLGNELRSKFYVNVDVPNIKLQVERLRSAGRLQHLPGGYLKISESALTELENTLKEAEEIEKKAKGRFIDVFTKCCPALATDEEWKTFNEKLLLPLVREVGARTYQLISGVALDLESTMRFPEFLAAHPSEYRQPLRNAIVTLLDPKDSGIRSYILRHLNAYFFVEAGSLPERTINAFAKITTNPPSFKIFVDTNFLFSFLGLHDNPSNEAAKSLMELTAQLKHKLSCKFYVSALTVDETKRVIGSHRDFIQGITLTSNLAEAALETDLSGIMRKFVEFSLKVGQPVNADEYFAPYLDNLISTLRAMNVELFNESMEAYATEQEVVDDILAGVEFEKRYGEKAKRYKQLEHDVILWHFINDKRPVRLESPLEATYWIVTVDYHFLGFDSFKRRNSRGEVPSCLHPTALIQMLQFWLPRTQQFEEAVMGSLRWPFLFQDFDPAAEKVTIRILEALARFENVGELPKEVLTSVLVNEALRQKLAVEGDVKKRVELVREALVEENEKVRSQLTDATERAADLERTLTQKEGEINELTLRLNEQTEKIEEAARELEEERQSRRGIEARVGDLEKRWEQERESASRRKEIRGFLISSGIALFLAIAMPTVTFVLWKPALGFWRATPVVWGALLLIWTELIDRWGQRRGSVREWPAYEEFHKFKKWLFVLLAALIVWRFYEFVGDAAYEWLKALPKG